MANKYKYTWEDQKTKEQFSIFSFCTNFNLVETYEETFTEWAGGRIIKRISKEDR
jgi:hypothetical protein